MLGFIARINAFCSASQLPSDPTTSDGNSSIEQTSLEHASPLRSGDSQAKQPASCDLSYAQITHLLRIYRTRFRPQMPIVELRDLDYTEQTHQTPSPLLDAITAYTLHYIYHSGLHNRLVGLNWPQFQAGPEIGMPYFQRCLSAVTQLSIFAVPSISVMQCYCFLISYLLDAGQHQAAYNMVGLALRFSQSLNYMDSRTGGYRECQLFRRIWWTLIHLDFRCSRHVGKPVSVQVEELMCLRPTREVQDIHVSNGLLYHTQSIRLTSAALLMNEAMDRFSLAGHTELEARAQNLSENQFHLQQWREEMRKEQSFAHLQFDILDQPADEHNNLSDGEYSSIEALLSTLLMLQYHNVIISLHRVFIQFPSHPLIPKSNPKADAHAATALNHAQTMIQIAYERMALHENLYGLSEVYQYLWNAVITIVGFMLAYPFCYRCIRARKPLDLALEIFDAVHSVNATAKRAATLTRHLCNKVDMLVRNLNVDQATTETSSVATSGQLEVQNQLSDFLWPATQSHDAGTQDVSDEPLWSWTDMINLDAWPTYCDEVNEAFMDPMDFSMLDSLM